MLIDRYFYAKRTASQWLIQRMVFGKSGTEKNDWKGLRAQMGNVLLKIRWTEEVPFWRWAFLRLLWHVFTMVSVSVYLRSATLDLEPNNLTS